MKTLIMRAPRAIARRRLFSTLVLLCILGGTPIFQGAPALAAIPDSTPGAAIPTGDQPDFGPNVYIFDPSMPTSQIALAMTEGIGLLSWLTSKRRASTHERGWTGTGQGIRCDPCMVLVKSSSIGQGAL